MITFEFDGKLFELEFKRNHETVDLVRAHGSGQDSKVKQVRSKYPYTTARLYMSPKSGGARTQLAFAKVGCAPTDLFKKSVGRLMALRALTRYLQISLREDRHTQKGLVMRMWDAYLNRGREAAKAAPKMPAGTRPTQPTVN